MRLIFAGLPTKRTTNLRTNLRLRTASTHHRFEVGGAAVLYRQSGRGSNTGASRAGETCRPLNHDVLSPAGTPRTDINGHQTNVRATANNPRTPGILPLFRFVK
jgi:hypothetical protein